MLVCEHARCLSYRLDGVMLYSDDIMKLKVEQILMWLHLIGDSGTGLRIDGRPEADCALVQVSTEAHAVALSAQMSCCKLHMLT